MRSVANGGSSITPTIEMQSACSLSSTDLPTLYIVASDASRSSQGQYVRFVRLEMGLVVLAATLGAVASLVPDEDAKSMAAPITLSLFAALIIRITNSLGRQDRYWFGGRAVAESVKTSAWRYMMRASPYDTDDAIADHDLRRTLNEILMSDLIMRENVSAVPGVVITPRMRDVRNLSLRERKACYLKARVQGQIDWYSTKSASSRRAAHIWLLAGLGAESAALVSALAGIYQPQSLNLIGVFAAFAATTTALTQLRRHDELAKSYALASRELIQLKDLIGSANREVTLKDHVQNTEAAISREHTMWVARRARI